SRVRPSLNQPSGDVQGRFSCQQEVLRLDEYRGKQRPRFHHARLRLGGAKELVHYFGGCSSRLVYDHQRGDLSGVGVRMMVINYNYWYLATQNLFSDLSQLVWCVCIDEDGRGH